MNNLPTLSGGDADASANSRTNPQLPPHFLALPYLSSLPGDAQQIGQAVRSHWGVENGLHWVMDMVFRDDECRIRSQNAPANFTTIKHVASNLLRRGKGKNSMRASRHVAAWNEDFLYSLLTQ